MKKIIFVLSLLFLTTCFWGLPTAKIKAETIDALYCECAPRDTISPVVTHYFCLPASCDKDCNNFCQENNAAISDCRAIKKIIASDSELESPELLDLQACPAPNINTPGAINSGGSGGASMPGKVQEAKLDNPTGISTINGLIAKIIQIFLGIIGTISLVMFIYGGYQIFSALGNSGKIKTGQQTLVYATVGILVVFTSYAILQFVFNIFGAK